MNTLLSLKAPSFIIKEGESHRTIECFVLEGTLLIIQSHGQRHLPLDKVTPSSVQSGLEHSQAWGNHSFSVSAEK